MKMIIQIDKILFLAMSLLSFMIFPSCKKNSDSKSDSASGYFLDVNINGQPFSVKTISVFGLVNQDGCDTKIYTHQNIGQIDVASYFVEVNLTHKQNKIDFTSSVPGTYAVKSEDIFSMTNPYPYGISCNLDLVVSLDDKTLSNQETTLLSTNRVNTITSISISKESSTKTTYDIIGNFSCSFKNSRNVTIPLTGKYKAFIEVLK